MDTRKTKELSLPQDCKTKFIEMGMHYIVIESRLDGKIQFNLTLLRGFPVVDGVTFGIVFVRKQKARGLRVKYVNFQRLRQKYLDERKFNVYLRMQRYGHRGYVDN